MTPLVAVLLYFVPAIILMILYKVYGLPKLLSFVQKFRAFIFNKIIYTSSVTRSEYNYIDSVLSEKNTFFKSLSLKGKAKFVKRLKRFNSKMKYEGREGLVVTDEMKILVASSAVQLTYGLNYYLIENLKGIVIYPSVFYNSIIKHHLKGGMPPKGKMMLSWEHVEHGFYYPNDRYNLALHEMAHALKFSIKRAYNFDLHFYSYLSDWKHYAGNVFANMKTRNENFLRDYAATNMEEFFAVSVEHFFEVPEDFQRELPRLYKQLSQMLNLNPLNKTTDYRL